METIVLTGTNMEIRKDLLSSKSLWCFVQFVLEECP